MKTKKADRESDRNHEIEASNSISIAKNAFSLCRKGRQPVENAFNAQQDSSLMGGLQATFPIFLTAFEQFLADLEANFLTFTSTNYLQAQRYRKAVLQK